ncbi:MAG: methyltransferase domain-containing protein [Chloroflexi bacterium]|nr:methyltransferase domain-containing protein [Chloroflexota bacterium]
MGKTNLVDIVQRQPNPAPWSEGDNIPWSDPDFSRRMLKEHLTQEHDAASRRFETIDKHVAWIHHQLLFDKPARILDLSCGPGLYASRLARLGHDCVGIDYSPASIEYAADIARREDLRCIYVHHDIRTADYGIGYDLVMLIYGELNVFRPADARAILEKVSCALAEDGMLLLEPHTFDAVVALGKSERSWYSSSSGLFSDEPHLVLTERFWDEGLQAATIRHFVVDATTGKTERYAQSLQAYTNDRYQALLQECGFNQIKFYPALGEDSSPSASDLIAILAHKSETL